MAEILDQSIEQVRAGADPEEVLQQYPPDVADQIRPLLSVAVAFESEPDPVPSVDDLMQAIVRLSDQQRPKKATAPRRRAGPSKRRWLLRVAAVILAMFAIGWGTVNISAEAMPGDLLYPIKVFTERAKFFLTVNQERKAELRIVFSAERLKEAVLKQQRGEGLDRELLSEMLEEARLAVEASAEFPEPTRDLFVARAAKLSEFQQDALGRLKSQVAPEEQEVVVQYMDMCGRRSVWMRQVLEPPPDQPGKPAGPSPLPRSRRLKEWMDSCPMSCN
jgi:hypothetical protein